MSKHRHIFRQNLRVPGLVRDELRNGTQYLVVPVVMLQEQVLFCSNCHPDGEFISAQEIMSSLLAWDNRPVTLTHPREPWTPSNYQSLEVGRVFNVFWDGKLKGEMWLDLQKLKSSMEGREVERRFREGEVTEVSTGYFVDRVAGAGTFNGTKFKLRQMGVVPDHLAILPAEVGACSIAGGCGAPRLNTNGEGSMDDETKLLQKFLKFLRFMKDGDDGSGSGSTDGVDELESGVVPTVVVNVNTGSAGNQDGGGTPASAPGDDGDSGAGDLDDGSSSSMNEQQKKDLVKRLLASGKVTTFDEKALLAMSDDQLKSLSTLAGCGCNDDGDGDGAGDTSANAGEGDAGDGGDADDGDGSSHNTGFSREDAQFVSQLRELSGGTVDGLSSLIEAGKAEAERRKKLKADLVTVLNKDNRVAMSEAVLNGMTLEALEGFDRSLNPQSYVGRGGPRIENEGDDAQFAPDPPAVVLNDADKGDDD